MVQSSPLTTFDKALQLPPRRVSLGREEKLLVNIGIVGFLLLATTLGIAETDFVSVGDKPFIRAFGAPIGMRQWWKVFGNVRTVNYHVSSLVEFADGTTRFYEFPNAVQMSLVDRFTHAPRTIFFGEKMPNNNFKKALPDIARFVARANSDPANPPRTVTFEIYSASITDPVKEKFQDRDAMPPHDHRQIFFVYPVQERDLTSSRP